MSLTALRPGLESGTVSNYRDGKQCRESFMGDSDTAFRFRAGKPRAWYVPS